jgi:3'-phosphoadenosine 5'-phosphosulfate sulfotransferase (PAPS reductase)/FAD synthetase
MTTAERRGRIVVWFSCGAASAVAGYQAIAKYGKDTVTLVYCDVMSTEHPDNARFLQDVETWLGVSVTVIRSNRYSSIDDVFEKTKYMAGIAGARCTAEMKKKPRFAFQRPDDLHIFGMVAEEQGRMIRLEYANPTLHLEWILRDENLSKADCLRIIQEQGIKLPTMYGLGFKNNNCIGCVKATSIAYWRKVRKHFPEVFERRVRQSRSLGVRLTRLHGQRIFIDEIPQVDADEEITEDISCGPDCGYGPAKSVSEMRRRLHEETNAHDDR